MAASIPHAAYPCRCLQCRRTLFLHLNDHIALPTTAAHTVAATRPVALARGVITAAARAARSRGLLHHSTACACILIHLIPIQPLSSTTCLLAATCPTLYRLPRLKRGTRRGAVTWRRGGTSPWTLNASCPTYWFANAPRCFCFTVLPRWTATLLPTHLPAPTTTPDAPTLRPLTHTFAPPGDACRGCY